MRHFALYLGLVAVIVASCSTKENDFEVPEQEDEIFYASFEKPVEEDTRVYANEDLLLRWTTDDRVSIFNKITYNQEYRFIGQTGDYEGGFNKVDNPEFMTGSEIPHVISIYPFQRQTRVSENEVITVSLPAEQSYAQNSFGLGDNTMVSVSSGNLLQYKSVGGFLVINLYGKNVTIESITLKGNNGEKLAGDATVTMPLNGVPTAVMASDATTEITLTCATPVQLGATEEESTQFWFVVPPVTFSKGFTITVRQYTGEVIEKSTSKSITIERNKLSKMSPLEMEGPTIPIPEAVDLGLPSGLKWASFNLGASKPVEYGDYYAWGETEPYYYYSSLGQLIWKDGKDIGYDMPSYQWCMGSDNTLTKYCNNSSYGYEGFTDSKTVLEPEDDAAYVNLGGKWRMPTKAEWQELIDNCTWTRTVQNGVNGYFVTAANGNSIFVPLAGFRFVTQFMYYYSDPQGLYWSSSLNADYPVNAWVARIFSRNGYDVNGTDFNRYLGLSVRPVYGDSAISVESISLDKTNLELSAGESFPLTLTLLPDNATYKSVTWSSSNTSVATISSMGVVSGVASGFAVITATTVDGEKTATCEVTVKGIAAPEPIDLDLPSGLKWGSFNLRASKPEENGALYAWGETEPKDVYTWETYKWCVGNDHTLTKYCADSSYGYDGFTDDKTLLDPEDDAAYVNLGGKWRMPTYEEWQELIDNCTWAWAIQNGVEGREVTGTNGNSIFIPTEGSTNYWSSSFDPRYPVNAIRIFCGNDNGSIGYVNRYYGFPVRPVYGAINEVIISVEASAELFYVNGDSVRIDPIRYEGFRRKHMTDNDLEYIFIDLTKHAPSDFTSAVLYLAVYNSVSGRLLLNETYGVVYNTNTGHYDFASL